MRLELKETSWENIFNVLRDNDLKPNGNFWAAIQSLEEQFIEQTEPKEAKP